MTNSDFMLATREDKVPEELADAFSQQATRRVHWFGTLSSYFHSSWPKLVDTLCEACGIERRVTADHPPDEFLDAAQEAKVADADSYFALLGSHFGTPVEATPIVYQVPLLLLFSAYVTENFDHLLVHYACRTLRARTASTLAGNLPGLDYLEGATLIVADGTFLGRISRRTDMPQTR
jgi:hypothetical protein